MFMKITKRQMDFIKIIESYIYPYYHYDDTLPNRVKEGEYIEVSFDEMQDWEKYYIVNGLNEVK